MTKRAALASASCLAVLATAGCGGSSGGTAGPGAPPTSGPATSVPASPATSPSTTPSTTPATTPATGGPEGAAVHVTGLSLHLPPGYAVLPGGAPDSPVAYQGRHGDISISLASVSNEGFPSSLPQSIRTYLHYGAGYRVTPATLPDVTIAGHRWWHLRGRTSPVTYDDVYGTELPEVSLSIEVEGDADTTHAQVLATAARVVATIVLHPEEQ